MSQTITTVWYHLNIDPQAQIVERRRKAPWYRTKTEPSTLDMLHALRYAIHDRRINPTTAAQAARDQETNPQVSADRPTS